MNYIAIHVDVTDLTLQKQALEVKSTQLEIVLEHMDQGISMVDADLKVVVSNERFRELLEFPKELVAKNADFEAFIRYNAERGEYGAGDVDELVKERVALAKQFQPHRFERVRPDGAVIEIRGIPVPGGGGMVTTYTDITERKRAEEALRENEQRLTLAMEGSNDGLWDWHTRADEVYFGARLKTILGLKSKSEKFTSKTWRSRIHPDDLEKYKQVFVAHLKGETDHFEFEYRVRGDDGEYRWIRDRGMQCPTQLIWGYNDPTAPVELGRALFDLIALRERRAQLDVFNQSGHFTYREHPQAFNAALHGFIEGCG